MTIESAYFIYLKNPEGDSFGIRTDGKIEFSNEKANRTFYLEILKGIFRIIFRKKGDER